MIVDELVTCPVRVFQTISVRETLGWGVKILQKTLVNFVQIYTSIRTRKAAPCTIFNKSKCLLWATWFIFPNSQRAFAFVEYGTRSCLSGSDRGVGIF